MYSSHLHKKNLFFSYSLFVLNQWTFRIKKWETAQLETLKFELFYIDGACQHSGFCCKNITIYKQGTPIDTTEKFTTLCHKDPVYTRFIPTTKNAKIKHFNCSCLLPNNWCSEHKTRPALCKNYPAINFISDEPFYEGCGYKVALKPVPKWVKNTQVLEMILKMQTLHNT